MPSVPSHVDPHAAAGPGTKQADTQLEANAKAKRKVKRHRQKRPRPWPVRILIGLIQLACLIYVGLLVALVMMEERLVYPGAYFTENSRSVSSHPAIETVAYLTTHDLTLQGRLIEREGTTNVVLFLHGNGTKAVWLDGWTKRLSDAFDANVLTAEYRGFADDDKTLPTESGLLEDSFAARNFLCERYKIAPDQVILYGRSLGGGCASAVASHDGAKALVLEKTFDNMVNVAADRYRYFPIRWLMKNRYDNVARLTNYQGPLVMVHGTADQMIPIRYGRRLFDSYHGGPKELLEIPGLDHNDPISDSVLSEAAQRTHQMIQ